jgi:hypothetical protein
MSQQYQRVLKSWRKLRSNRIAGRSSKSTRRSGGVTHASSETSDKLQRVRLAKLTSFLADSLVKTYPSLVSKPAYATVSAAVCTLNSCALSGSYDPVRSYWKTSQISLMPDWTSYLERLPKSAMTVSGRLYELPMLAHRTSGNDGSALQFPTARATDYKNGRSPEGLAKAGRTWSNGLHDAVTHWATVTADDANNATRASGAFSSLTRDVLTWATPNAADNQGTHGGGQGRSLRTDMHTWATPVASDTRGLNHGNREGRSLRKDLHKISHPNEILNPDWVELLMGYPVGWTSPASQVAQTNRNTAMNRRVLVRKGRRSSAQSGYTRSGMRSSRSKPSRSLTRYTNSCYQE